MNAYSATTQNLLGLPNNTPLTIASGAIVKVYDLCSTWSKRSSQRRALKNLDSRLLQDIGISHDQAIIEQNKPFWVA